VEKGTVEKKVYGKLEATSGDQRLLKLAIFKEDTPLGHKKRRVERE